MPMWASTFGEPMVSGLDELLIERMDSRIVLMTDYLKAELQVLPMWVSKQYEPMALTFDGLSIEMMALRMVLMTECLKDEL